MHETRDLIINVSWVFPKGKGPEHNTQPSNLSRKMERLLIWGIPILIHNVFYWKAPQKTMDFTASPTNWFSQRERQASVFQNDPGENYDRWHAKLGPAFVPKPASWCSWVRCPLQSWHSESPWFLGYIDKGIGFLHLKTASLFSDSEIRVSLF